MCMQIRLMGNFGLNTSIPMAKTTDGAICFICKEGEETLHHFLFDCTGFREHFDILWSSLSTKVIRSNPTDGNHMSDFLVNLEQHQKSLLLIGCLPLPFYLATIMMITCFQQLVTFRNCALKSCMSWRLHGLPNNLVKFTAFFLF